jgi:rRNA-processing protein FCF1
MGQTAIISDANVLIDYAKSAPEILGLISRYIRQLYIPLPILREVRQLNRNSVEKLGVKIIEPTLEQIIEANKIRTDKPTISKEDAICLVIAKDNDWSCLTNDRALRICCSEFRVHCLWGIGIMQILVSNGKLSPEKAVKIAQDIQSKNKYITESVIKNFQKNLGL